MERTVYDFELLLNWLRYLPKYIKNLIKKKNSNDYLNKNNDSRVCIDISLFSNKKYPKIKWNHYFLSQKPNKIWEIIENNPDIKLNYKMSQKPNIIWGHIKNNPEIQI